MGRTAVSPVVRRLGPLGHPARLTVVGFAVVNVLGALLLMLPVASESGEWTAPVTALFTSTSAVCVTGLVVVDTATYWSPFGEAVVLALIQIGGLGIMTAASLLGLLVARRMGLRMQLIAQAETKTLRLGETRRVVIGVVVMSLSIEVLVAAAITARQLVATSDSFGSALYYGVFHAISAYNNAGFGLRADSLVAHATDPFIIAPIAVALVLGGIGFPVVFELSRAARARMRGRRLRGWSLHTKITLITYFGLMAVGIVLVTALEWSNPGTLGPLSYPGRLLAGAFHGITPRTAGFNSVDVGAMSPTTLLVNDVLMFVGGGSAGTAGGIKVTTFALLAFVVVAEVRGQPTVHVMGRRLAATVQRQAITVALLGVAVVMVATMILLRISHFPLDAVLFEAVSAFGTVGLSTGITAELSPAAHLILVLLMFIGRVGPITLASALALREHERRYELPEERPIVG
ncbi:TrkH family potassium uptake protein [Nocardia cyriacigeorgica]|uniref:TrkH family potassium uptake protein n=1 Tax=Nocardia cyriacigeorgica TaxID=135487 RepID=UPI0018942CB8|nr:potassium transporter TrkG [Nocardia cyriacigeorgica]MBF6082870.1 TrkH family potassium uptake protein [Nocardia cyriacigeorgica]